jgi:uncharacterized Tic20 family protein
MSAEQETFLLAMFFKPFVAFVFFFVAVVLGRLILWKMPEGKVKRLLSRDIGP